MTKTPVQSTRWLLDQLEDPFTMFPVEGVASTLFEAVEGAETQKRERMGPWGVARRFWSVEEEYYHEKIGLLIGALFVLGQASITQTVSILNELHPRAKSVIPQGKPEKLVAHAATETKTKISKIVIINAVSNYFKHVYEWPEPWEPATKRGQETATKRGKAETIDIVLKLGFKPGEMTDNLYLAADHLGLCQSNPTALAEIIQEWREGWARALYSSFELPDPAREQENEE